LLVLFLLFDNCIWFFWKLIVLSYPLDGFVLGFDAVRFALLRVVAGWDARSAPGRVFREECLFWVWWLSAWLFMGG
jgi:hypothetical protein